MNNVCKRNCYWNYCNQCVCECGTHDEDGTAYTKNCSQFLISNFDERLCSLPDEIMEIVNKLPYAELKKAKYAVSQIWKEVIGIGSVQKNQEIELLRKDRDYWEREAKKWAAELGEQKIQKACMNESN